MNADAADPVGTYAHAAEPDDEGPMPVQCPDCGRFLSAAFVHDLVESAAPCPRCDTILTSAMLAPDDAASGRRSVRPPDLEPEPATDDPLADWDTGGDVVDLAERRGHPAPVPDAAALAGASIVGLVSGLLLARRKVRGAMLGAITGLALGAVSRRIWELEE